MPFVVYLRTFEIFLDFKAIRSIWHLLFCRTTKWFHLNNCNKCVVYNISIVTLWQTLDFWQLFAALQNGKFDLDSDFSSLASFTMPPIVLDNVFKEVTFGCMMKKFKWVAKVHVFSFLRPPVVTGSSTGTWSHHVFASLSSYWCVLFITCFQPFISSAGVDEVTSHSGSGGPGKKRFWNRCLTIVERSSGEMLRLNREPAYFAELFRELKTYASSSLNYMSSRGTSMCRSRDMSSGQSNGVVTNVCAAKHRLHDSEE